MFVQEIKKNKTDIFKHLCYVELMDLDTPTKRFIKGSATEYSSLRGIGLKSLNLDGLDSGNPLDITFMQERISVKYLRQTFNKQKPNTYILRNSSQSVPDEVKELQDSCDLLCLFGVQILPIIDARIYIMNSRKISTVNIEKTPQGDQTRSNFKFEDFDEIIYPSEQDQKLMKMILGQPKLDSNKYIINMIESMCQEIEARNILPSIG